jgi:hypothetical protein
MSFRLIKKWAESHKLNRLRTLAHAALRPCSFPRVAFIFGCQRSGTTLLRNFIGLDSRFRDIGEGDTPYFHQERGSRYLRLLEDDQVEALVCSQKSPWVLLKPLHDSQRAVELLARFKESRGIWIFRHYDMVVQSHLGYYRHDPMEYLQPLKQMDRSSWMLSGLENQNLERVRELVELAGESVANLYAVFWYARNALLFQHLQRANLLVVAYEDLVGSPHQCLQAFNRHLGTELSTQALVMPRKSAANSVSSSALMIEIRIACEEMYKELLAVRRVPLV